MNLRTVIDPVPSSDRIGYFNPVMFTGSCFSSEIGAMFESGKMNVMVNPFGVLYNPLSVLSELEIIVERRQFNHSDLQSFNNRYLSFSHDTGFSSANPETTLEKINGVTNRAHRFLADADYLFVTFGTARIFRYKQNNSIVANCHKMPASNFERELLTVEYIAENWTLMLKKLWDFNPRLKIYFTISPVRHWKDGAHGNQVSKAVLLLAIEKLITSHSRLNYFPSYELVLDDLRDYRFYKDDLLHPGRKAIEYIWEYLKRTFFDPDTKSIYSEVSKIVSARNHRLMGDIEEDHRGFAESMISKIEDLKKRHPFLDLDQELHYFSNISGR